MADTLAENLKNEIATRVSWTTPCTFKRTNKIPIDAKSCFKTYAELEEYINDPESTAYPGMFVAVTSNQDQKRGGYILMGNEDDELVPMSVSGIKSLTLKGDGDSEIQAEVDNTGHATLTLDEMEFDTLESNELMVNGFNIGLFMTFLETISNLNEVDPNDEEYTLEDLKNKFNYLLRTIKRAIDVSQEQEDSEGTENANTED